MEDKDYFYYYVFCLGYDFMNEAFKNSTSPECDVVFYKCKNLIDKFIDSEEYQKPLPSASACLCRTNGLARRSIPDHWC